MISLTTGLHHVVFKGRNVVWYFDIEDVFIMEHKSVYNQWRISKASQFTTACMAVEIK